jgi:hypothetical protein
MVSKIQMFVDGVTLISTERGREGSGVHNRRSYPDISDISLHSSLKQLVLLGLYYSLLLV